MKTYLTSGFAALLIAAGFAGTAAAQAVVYDDPYNPRTSPPTIQQDRGTDLDMSTTGSIYPNAIPSTAGNADLDGAQDTGDYYDGIQRPHN